MPTEVESIEEEASLGANINSQPGTAFACAYLTFLFCAQAAYAYLYVHSAFLRAIFAVPTAVRLATWTLPVLVYLIAIKQSLIDFLKLGNVCRGIIWGLAIGSSLVLRKSCSAIDCLAPPAAT